MVSNSQEKVRKEHVSEPPGGGKLKWLTLDFDPGPRVVREYISVAFQPPCMLIC